MSSNYKHVLLMKILLINIIVVALILVVIVHTSIVGALSTTQRIMDR